MHALFVALLIGLMPPPGTHVQTDGKALFDTSCRKCHGVKGVPSPSMKRMMPKLPVLDAATMSKISRPALADVIRKGKGDMKPLGDKLTPEQVNAIVEYVFTLANAKSQESSSGK